MHIPHLWGVVGLASNTVGALMLLWFPPDTKGFQKDGSWRGWWSTGPTEKGKREYRYFRSGFQLAISLLALGFLLQLLDLLKG